MTAAAFCATACRKQVEIVVGLPWPSQTWTVAPSIDQTDCWTLDWMSNHGGNAVTGTYQIVLPDATDFAPPLIAGPGSLNDVAIAVLSPTSFWAAAISLELELAVVVSGAPAALVLELLVLLPQAATPIESTATVQTARVVLRTHIVVSLLGFCRKP